jgi:hypothetical protein
MKLAFSGCRNARAEHCLRTSILAILWQHKPEMVLVGDAMGVDWMVRSICDEEAQPYTVFRPDWEKYKKAAGPIRNQAMLKEADKLIAFWDGKSRGTRNAIKTAMKMGLRLEVREISP